MAEGRFDEAKTLIAEVRDIGGGGNLTVALGYSAQVCALRAELGEADKVINVLRGLRDDSSPLTFPWRTMLAGLYADVGRLDEAASELEVLAGNGFSRIAEDWAFPLAVRYLAEICAQLNDVRLAGQLLPRAEPYSGQLLVVTQGTSIEGAADRSLAQLHAVLGNVEDAHRHYTAASQLEEEMGFSPLAARTHYWHARLLARTHFTQEGAGRLLDVAQSTAAALNMDLLHRQTRQLRDELKSSD